jgi:transposase
MDVIVERCCGLDVHKDTVVACVRTPGSRGQRSQETVTFGATTVELLALRDWLVAEKVTLVGMESTGVYWKPVYYVWDVMLESQAARGRAERGVRR